MVDVLQVFGEALIGNTGSRGVMVVPATGFLYYSQGADSK